MKNAMKQMTLFTLLINVIGVVSMLIGIGFLWPLAAGIAYIFFDRRLNIGSDYRFKDRFLIYFVITVIWWSITLLFAAVTLWAATKAPWVEVLEAGGYDPSYAGLIYGAVFVLLYICVPLVIGIAFVVRSIQAAGRDKTDCS